MRKIYTIGETVLDIIFKNGQPVASKAGGSMLNTAVSLGRRGGLKGGTARAAKMTAERRVEIARKAAKTRWNKGKSPP